MDQRCKEALDGDNCVLLAFFLKKAYVGLFERGLSGVGDIGGERCLETE